MSVDLPPTSAAGPFKETEFCSQGYQPSTGFKETIPDPKEVVVHGRGENPLMQVFTTRKTAEIARQTIDQIPKEKRSQSIVWSPRRHRQDPLPFTDTSKKEKKLRVLKTITIPPKKKVESTYDPGKIFGYDAPGGLGANLIA